MPTTKKMGIPPDIDDDLKMLYEQMIYTGEQAVDFIKKEFKKDQLKDKVKFKFVSSGDYFSAYPIKTSKGYKIDIQDQIIPLLRTLFDGLLEPKLILPKLNDSKSGLQQKSSLLLFRKNTAPKGLYESIKITSAPLKLNLSSLLTELCCAFIIFHEVSHIALWHVDNQHIKREIFKIREADSDTLASQLMAMYIVSYEDTVLSVPHLKKIFKKLRAEKYLLENITALASSALSCMFVYMAHALNSEHKYFPHLTLYTE